MLDITAQMVNGKVWSGGVAARFGDKYGRYEVRIRTDSDPASVMGGAALTWPDSGKWPCEGELDFYETRAGIAGDYIHSFLHYGCANKQHWIGNGYSGEDWHVMVMEWEPNSIRVYKDGVLTGRLADPAKIPDFSHHLTVQLDPRSRRSLIVPVHLNVDYVRIYTR